MPRLIWGHSPHAWHAMFAAVAKAEGAQRRVRRQKLIREIVDIYVEVVECGAQHTEAVLDVSKALMEIMTRAEQLEMLALLLRRADDGDRDDALELITALLPYAKARRNAPRSEIAGVSMFAAIVKASTHREHL